MAATRIRVLLSAVAITAVLTMSPQWSPAQDSAARPILYDDYDDASGKFVTSAVYPDGRVLKGLVPATGAFWSPDGTRFAVVKHAPDAGAVLVLRNVSGDETTVLTVERGGGMLLPMWAPDGRRLAVLTFQARPNHERSNFLVVIDTASNQTVLRQEISQQTIHLPYFTSPLGKFGWSPDGRKILIAWENVIVVDAQTGRVETIAPAPAIAEWAPDGSGVYYFAMKNYRDPRTRALGGFYLKKLGGSAVTLLDEGRVRAAGLDFLPLILGRLALSPSGQALAVAIGRTNQHAMVLQVYDLKTGRADPFGKPSKTFDLQRLVLALAWAPDESGLAALTVGDDGLRVERLDLAGGEWKVLTTIVGGSKVNSLGADALGFLGLSWAR